jgi:hypothetical protein
MEEKERETVPEEIVEKRKEEMSGLLKELHDTDLLSDDFIMQDEETRELFEAFCMIQKISFKRVSAYSAREKRSIEKIRVPFGKFHDGVEKLKPGTIDRIRLNITKRKMKFLLGLCFVRSERDAKEKESHIERSKE